MSIIYLKHWFYCSLCAFAAVQKWLSEEQRMIQQHMRCWMLPHIIGNVWSVFEKCNQDWIFTCFHVSFSGQLTSLAITTDCVCSKLGYLDCFQFTRAWNLPTEIHNGSVCFDDWFNLTPVEAKGYSWLHWGLNRAGRQALSHRVALMFLFAVYLVRLQMFL